MQGKCSREDRRVSREDRRVSREILTKIKKRCLIFEALYFIVISAGGFVDKDYF